MLLLSPPGWTLVAGGPHIALPILKSSLQAHGLGVEIADLNVDAALWAHSFIGADDALSASHSSDFNEMTRVFVDAESALNKQTVHRGASWDAQYGLLYREVDPASSESVRSYLSSPGVLHSYYAERVTPLVQSLAPSIIGISVTSQAQLIPGLELCRHLRVSGYDGKILLGGNCVTRIGVGIALDWLFEIIDGIVLFSGEAALLGLADCVHRHDDDWRNVPGLIWRTGNQIVHNSAVGAGASEHWNTDFQGLPLGAYWGVRYLPILGSLGCYYGKCTFCAIPYGWGPGGFQGHRTPDSIVADLQSGIDRHGVARFKFVEEAIHPGLLARLGAKITQAGLQCEFEGYARFDSSWTKAEVIASAAAMGLRKVYLGLEIAGGNRRNLLSKSDNADPLDMLRKLADVGIKAHLFCMFGYPGTTVDDAVATIEFALMHRELIDTLDIFPFGYAKHTHVPFIEPVIDRDKDWAVDYDFVPSVRGVLSPSEIFELTTQLEEVVWDQEPLWLHPIYRMCSPWDDCPTSFATDTQVPDCPLLSLPR